MHDLRLQPCVVCPFKRSLQTYTIPFKFLKQLEKDFVDFIGSQETINIGLKPAFLWMKKGSLILQLA